MWIKRRHLVPGLIGPQFAQDRGQRLVGVFGGDGKRLHDGRLASLGHPSSFHGLR